MMPVHIFPGTGVIDEVKDAKSRNHLATLPFEMVVREPSAESCRAVAHFSRLTGDYRSLSIVDLKILALQYDLDVEGCNSSSHLRSVPKRALIGKIEALRKNTVDNQVVSIDEEKKKLEEEDVIQKEESKCAEEVSRTDTVVQNCDIENKSTANIPMSWASRVNILEASVPTSEVQTPFSAFTADGQLKIKLSSIHIEEGDEDVIEGQFSDAEEEFSEESESKDNQSQSILETELQSHFPCLSAATTVPYDGSGDESDESKTSKPRTFYNSFPKSQNVVTPLGIGDSLKLQAKAFEREKEIIRLQTMQEIARTANAQQSGHAAQKSRIIGGSEIAGQSVVVDDDGEGWTNVSNYKTQQVHFGGSSNSNFSAKKEAVLAAGEPPLLQRAACATTDFAMQNVILQMGMKLVGLDGRSVRRLKQWVMRCSACTAIYPNGIDDGRLFCERCGSNTLERIAASVDAKTGRYRLHFSKKRAKRGHNLRGTKYSLPKPGSGNRFEGDLLLREDQLMMGAWNQKVKKGGKKLESIFGSDIVSHVGLGDLTKRNDIKVGLGRQNPNATRQGRERRGKKKKDVNKACGVRRY